MAMHRVRQEMQCGKAKRARTEEALLPWGGERAGVVSGTMVNHVRPHDRCTEGNKSTKLGAQLCPELPWLCGSGDSTCYESGVGGALPVGKKKVLNISASGDPAVTEASLPRALFCLQSGEERPHW